MFDHLFYIVFCFLPTSRVSCWCASFFVPNVRFLHQDRIIVPRPGRLAASRNWAASAIFWASQNFGLFFLENYFKPMYVLRQLWRWLSCILSLPMAATMCIITLCTIPLLCTITLHNCFVHNTFVHKTFVHNTFALHNCFGQKYFGCLVSYPTSGSPPAAT